MSTKRDERILVVENNPSIVRAIEQAGQRLAIETDFASDGWEAIEKLENENYAAIVINTDLPRHSGFGVLTYLHEEVGPDLGNVIVMSSADHDQLRRKLSDRVTIIRTTDVVDDLARVMSSAVDA